VITRQRWEQHIEAMSQCRCRRDIDAALFLNNTWHDDQGRMSEPSDNIIIIIIRTPPRSSIRSASHAAAPVVHTALVRVGDSAYPTRRRTATFRQHGIYLHRPPPGPHAVVAPLYRGDDVYFRGCLANRFRSIAETVEILYDFVTARTDQAVGTRWYVKIVPLTTEAFGLRIYFHGYNWIGNCCCCCRQ